MMNEHEIERLQAKTPQQRFLGVLNETFVMRQRLQKPFYSKPRVVWRVGRKCFGRVRCGSCWFGKEPDTGAP